MLSKDKKKDDNTTKKLSKSFDDNVLYFKELFYNDNSIIFRQFENQYSNTKYCIIFVDGMANNEIINENIIQPIVRSLILKDIEPTTDFLISKVIFTNNVEKNSDIDKNTEAILSGDTVLLMENSQEAAVIRTKDWKIRAIEEPQTEKVLRGPREGFTEAILVNLSLLRRKLKTSDLKFNFRTMGRRSNTKICVCHIDGIVNKKVLAELNKRLDDIDIDGILLNCHCKKVL